MALRGRPNAARPVVFLDKDGTLVEDVPFNVDPERIVLARGAASGLPRIEAAGFRIAVVSNQPGVARELFSETALAHVERRLAELLARIGVTLAGFYYCPHDPDGSVAEYRRRCSCRKPAAGLLERGARDLGADLARSWLVGDILDDIEAGRRAGCRTILLDNGNETEWRMSRQRLPHHTAADLGDAARLIVALAASPSRPIERGAPAPGGGSREVA